MTLLRGAKDGNIAIDAAMKDGYAAVVVVTSALRFISFSWIGNGDSATMAERTGIMAALKAILLVPARDWTIATDAKWALHRIEYRNGMLPSDQTSLLTDLTQRLRKRLWDVATTSGWDGFHHMARRSRATLTTAFGRTTLPPALEKQRGGEWVL